MIRFHPAALVINCLRVSVLGCLLLGISAAWAQPSDELIDKLLQLSKEKKARKPGKEDDELRKLLIRRYNVALEELKENCDNFRKNLATKATVFEAGKHLLQADLELQSRAEDRAKVLEKSLEVVKWYEQRLERANKEKLIPRPELLRIQYNRLTLEIDLLKTQQEMKSKTPR